MKIDVFLCNRCMGIIDAQGGPPPANLEQLFPVWNDPSTWNLAALAPITRFYQIGLGTMKVYPVRHIYAGWVQDDWAMTPHLTLNLGLRYDFGTGNENDISLPPFLQPGRRSDKNNWGPRVGFAYSVTDKTVLRGGFGKYFAGVDDNEPFWTMLQAGEIIPQVLNDGRPDFTVNPFNGPIPTFEQALASGKYIRFAPIIASPNPVTSYSYQTSIGVQRQLGNTMSFEADYVYTGSRDQGISQDINLAYDAATGINFPFTGRTKKPYAGWDGVNMRLRRGGANYHGLQLGFTKRMSNHWQASATYLLAGQWNLQPAPINPGCKHPMTMPSPGVSRCDVPIQLHPALAQEWYLSDDQRQRVTFNGMWDVGYGFQLSGLYLFGDNGWETPISGVDALRTGSIGLPGGRVRADGTLIPRRSLDRSDLHRVDMRVQRRFRIGRKAGVDGILEVFNLFNHANYGSFVTVEANRMFGQPSFNENIAYAPRTLQLGFRATF